MQPRSLRSHAAFAASLCSGRSRQPLPVVPGQARREPGRQSLQPVFAASLCSQPGSLCSHCRQPGSRCRQPLQWSFSAAVTGGGRRETSSSGTTAWSYGVELRRGVTAWSHDVEFQRALWPTAPLRVLLAAWGPGLGRDAVDARRGMMGASPRSKSEGRCTPHCPTTPAGGPACAFFWPYEIRREGAEGIPES